jgi:SAM-dependent methyltransferase
MITAFPLFSSHLDAAHSYWKQLLKVGDIVVDATCGNGHDTLFLSTLALSPDEGRVIAFDIQQQAIEASSERLQAHLPPELCARVQLIHGSHADFPATLSPSSVKLIVYNLGYLPGSNKRTTTTAEVTVASVEKGLELLTPGGMISITCYPGHAEGAREETLLLQFAEKLDPRLWSCSHQRWLNRKQAPSLLLIQKSITFATNLPD